MLARVGEGQLGARKLGRASDELRCDKVVVLAAVAKHSYKPCGTRRRG